MEKFELYFFIKPLIIIFIVAITLIVIQMFLKNLYNIEVLCIGGLLIVFGFYLLCTFLAISKDKFKNVSIDNENERFILTAKNGQIMAIPFNNLEGIYIQQGEILRGIQCAHVTFVTQDNKAFGLTVSQSNAFYVSLPKHIKQSMEEKLFYLPKWNNV